MINQTIRYLRRRLILLSHFMSGRFWWFNQKISRETNHSTFCNILRNQFCEITNQISKFILYWRECLVNKIICYVFSLFLTKNLFYNVKKKLSSIKKIKKLHNTEIWRLSFSPFIRGSNILLICVYIKPLYRDTWRGIYKQLHKGIIVKIFSGE